jgi:hypothetical protein
VGLVVPQCPLPVTELALSPGPAEAAYIAGRRVVADTDWVRPSVEPERQAPELELVHPDLEWTCLDPGMENPQPQTCHGREQLAWALGQQADRGSYLVLTMGRGRIVALRDFRGRDEARGFAGLGQGKR